jgi:hypothetical protein
VLKTSRFRNIAIGASALIVTTGVMIVIDRDRAVMPPAEPPRVGQPEADPGLIDDPIAPDRPLRVIAARGADGGIGGKPDASIWEPRRPETRWRATKSRAERDHVDPCDPPDPGFEGFSRWRPVSAGTSHLVPKTGGIDDEGHFDVMFHFHGHELARRGFLEARAPIVLVGTSSGSGYRARFAGADGLDHLLRAIEATLSVGRDPPAKARRVALSSWSGGYEAVAALLEHDADRVDAVVLLDGLHASRRSRQTRELQLAPFVAFARRAVRGEVFMLVTHSSVDTDGFASTTETAQALIQAVGGSPLEVRRADPLGLELISAFSSGDFHVRGHAGGGKPDHCAQLGMMKEATLAVARRWKLR